MQKVKILIVLFCLGIFLIPLKLALASEQLNVYFFWGEGCPHCLKEREALKDLKSRYPDINIYAFEIYNHGGSISLLKEINQKLNIRVDGVPFVIIGDVQLTGFSEYLTPQALEKQIIYCLEDKCPDSVADIINASGKNDLVTIEPDCDQNSPENNINEENPIPKKEASPQDIATDKTTDTIKLPIINEINPKAFSLPVLTIILGFVDGFNPCAMWTLLFLISILLGMKNRKRMWILGTTFVVVSALIYFLFMVAWLNLILFLSFIALVRIIIGLVSLLGGAYNLKEFFTNKNSGCKVTKSKKRQLIFEKIKSITQLHSFWLALGGIIILACAVNLVELICSAGLPAIYTQILALNDLAAWQYYSYISLYVFVFMLDDLFIFITAMLTLRMTGITTKYTHVSKLVGGILLAVIGLLLIFKPEWLMLG